MTAIDVAEIGPSLVTFLDVGALRRCPGSSCTTPVVAGVVHGTNRNGPFLVLGVNAVARSSLCVPLYGSGGPQRMPLDQKLKTGPGRGWREGLSFFSVYEFWLIPLACFAEASHIEFSEPGNRQRYAQRHPEALDAIIAHKDDSRSPFTPVRA